MATILLSKTSLTGITIGQADVHIHYDVDGADVKGFLVGYFDDVPNRELTDWTVVVLWEDRVFELEYLVMKHTTKGGYRRSSLTYDRIELHSHPIQQFLETATD